MNRKPGPQRQMRNENPAFQIRSSWGQFCGLHRFGRFAISISCVLSIPVNNPTPPASKTLVAKVLSRARPFSGRAEGQREHAMFFCYILECADGSYYIGVSDDPERRTREHDDGKGSNWTAARRPVRLAWTEPHLTLSSARKRENQLKRWNHAKKAALTGGSPRLRSGQTQPPNG